MFLSLATGLQVLLLPSHFGTKSTLSVASDSQRTCLYGARSPNLCLWPSPRWRETGGCTLAVTVLLCFSRLIPHSCRCWASSHTREGIVHNSWLNRGPKPPCDRRGGLAWVSGSIPTYCINALNDNLSFLKLSFVFLWGRLWEEVDTFGICFLGSLSHFHASLAVSPLPRMQPPKFSFG